MSKVILFPQENGNVAVMASTGALSVEETAKKDVPTGTPYLIVNASELPVDVPQEAWVVDFSEPHGFGS